MLIETGIEKGQDRPNKEMIEIERSQSEIRST